MKKGSTHKIQTIQKIKEHRKGKGGLKAEAHPFWKGDLVGYWGIHKWIARHFGTPKSCENCGTKQAKKYEWANVSHRYKRDISDWVRLCTKCHINYDKGNISLTIS